MKKIALLASCLTAGLLLAGCTLPGTSSNQDAKKIAAPSESPAALTSSPAPATGDSMSKTITLDEIAQHSTPTDCWFAIDGKVYDVTKYIASQKHPGGEAITFGCGKDASQMFHNRGEDKEDHSDQAKKYLQTMQIGVLAQ